MVHGHIAGKGYGKIIFEGALGYIFIILSLQNIFKRLACFFGVLRIAETVIENFENEFIAFFAILAHQRIEVFHSGRFERLKTKQLESLSDSIKDECSFSDYFGS